MAIRVFLVEDMKHQHDVVSQLLASLGAFEVIGKASTEAEAIQWLLDHPRGWDLAVVDLVLEQGTGMGIIARCANRAPGAKVVVFSDYVTPGIRKHCLHLGADAAIAKTQQQEFLDFCSQLSARPAA